jgi:hypothetical protein
MRRSVEAPLVPRWQYIVSILTIASEQFLDFGVRDGIMRM